MKVYRNTSNRSHILVTLARTAVCVATLVSSSELFAAPASTNGLVWDAESKELSVQPGMAKAHFKFCFTNTTSKELSILSAKSTCFCTVAQLPSEPWAIPAGGTGSIDVTMDLAGKRGNVTKAVNIATTAGNNSLLIRVNIPYDSAPAPVTLPTISGSGSEEERLKNLQLALADRQVVFKKAECAECHAKPANHVSSGAELYAGVCAVCHDSAHRASTVPDLKVAGNGQNLDYWRNWIAHGRPGTMMPAFANSEGGPLAESQLESLAEYLAMTVVASRPKPPGNLHIAPEFSSALPLAR